MSYDLRIWCVNEPHLDRALAGPAEWRWEGNVATYSAKGWQLACYASGVEPEDIPETVARALPGISWLAEIHLSPTSAAAGQTLLKRVAKCLSRDAHGVIEDLQEETLTLATGVKRFTTPERAERTRVIRMSWWTNTSSLRDPAALDRLVDVIRDTLPEAMPRRYGDYEPPQYKLMERGEEHFREFLKKSVLRTCGPVIYPTRPVVAFSISSDDAPGPCSTGYRANWLSVKIEAAALRQPGWQKQLRKFWERVSSMIEPFYGDVRISPEQAVGNGMVPPAAIDESHPVVGWWWNGVPEPSALALVLGDPYRYLWRISGPVVEGSGLRFASVDDWESSDRLTQIIGQPPREIAQPKGVHFPRGLARWSRREAYPPSFPFEIRPAGDAAADV